MNSHQDRDAASASLRNAYPIGAKAEQILLKAHDLRFDSLTVVTPTVSYDYSSPFDPNGAATIERLMKDSGTIKIIALCNISSSLFVNVTTLEVSAGTVTANSHGNLFGP